MDPGAPAAGAIGAGPRLRRLKFGHGGGKLAATAGGTVIGALLVSSAGRSLDRRRRYPDSGRLRLRDAAAGRPRGAGRRDCREYVQTGDDHGEVQDAYGTACASLTAAAVVN